MNGPGCAVFAVLLAALLNAAGSMQEKPETPFTLVSNVDLVVLHATVRDRRGPVMDLAGSDFAIRENGRLQELAFFRHEDVPLAAGLVIDSSGSMRSKRNDVLAAAEAFVRKSNRDDEMFVLRFNERVDFGLPETKIFSADRAELESALPRSGMTGKTALYDALHLALLQLGKASLPKRVIVLITDGGDNASRLTLKELIHEAESSSVIVYAIGLFDEDDPDRNPGVLRKIANATGGEVFLPAETSSVTHICEQIAHEIRHQYMLGYEPKDRNFDGAYRTIGVTATRPGGGKLTVHTRQGYISGPVSK